VVSWCGGDVFVDGGGHGDHWLSLILHPLPSDHFAPMQEQESKKRAKASYLRLFDTI